MCSIAQEGEQASPAQGSRLIGCHFLVATAVDNYAHILVKSLPNGQELVHISVHKCIPIYTHRLALSSKAVRYPLILFIITSSNLMP